MYGVPAHGKSEIDAVCGRVAQDPVPVPNPAGFPNLGPEKSRFRDFLKSRKIPVPGLISGRDSGFLIHFRFRITTFFHADNITMLIPTYSCTIIDDPTKKLSIIVKTKHFSNKNI